MELICVMEVPVIELICVMEVPVIELVCVMEVTAIKLFSLSNLPWPSCRMTASSKVMRCLS